MKKSITSLTKKASSSSASLSPSNPYTFLSTLQSWQLKHLAQLTGQNSTGTKAQLSGILSTSLSGKSSMSVSGSGSGSGDGGYRILSIDMGVKNLAFCLLEVKKGQSMDGGGRDGMAGNAKAVVEMRLKEWRKIDVTERLLFASDTSSSTSLSASSETRPQKSQARQDQSSEQPQSPDELRLEEDSPTTDTLNLFTPSSLSKIAYILASTFLSYSPDTILIERQRFRSGGAPAIQEWTVRVNMLESMIWACLETMKHHHSHLASQSALQKSTRTSQNDYAKGGSGGDGEEAGEEKAEKKFPELWEMSPRRIGMFWLSRGRDWSVAPTDIATCLSGPKPLSGSKSGKLRAVDGDGTATTITTSPSKNSFEKKDKIALARSWLRHDENGARVLIVDERLRHDVDAFVSPVRIKARRKEQSGVKRARAKKGVAEEEGREEEEGIEEVVVEEGVEEVVESESGKVVRRSKLDDLADCLVQAVTFGVWQGNKLGLLEYIKTRGD